MPRMIVGDPKIAWNGKKPGWQHTATGINGGRFGRVEHSAMVDPKGNFLFDRALVVEGPHIITVTWGYCPRTSVPYLALVKEVRDSAAPADGVSTMSFWGTPRGFRNADTGETPEEAARREAGEEAGARAFVSTRYLGEIWVNETCVASPSPVVAVEVDLTKLGEISDEAERGEKIFKAQFFDEATVESMIAAGSHEGAFTTSAVLMMAVTYWKIHVLASLPARQVPSPV